MAYLKNKWVGIAAILLFSLFSASRIASFVKPMILQTVPSLNQAVKPFLPIDIKNGEIVGEARFVKTTIPVGMGQAMDIVLDTNVDTFNPEDIKGQGIYISKKNIYAAKSNEITIRSLSTYGDMNINEQSMQVFTGYLLKVSEYAFAFFFVTFLIAIMLVVLIYTLLTYIALFMFAKSRFSQMYVVNSVVYSVLGMLALFTPISCGKILMFVILVLVNYAYGKFQE